VYQLRRTLADSSFPIPNHASSNAVLCDCLVPAFERLPLRHLGAAATFHPVVISEGFNPETNWSNAAARGTIVARAAAFPEILSVYETPVNKP